MLLKYKYSSKEDFADHNSGVDAMLEKGFIDKDNLFIAGGSAGGIATAYAIGLTNRFNAAVVVKPVINWLSKVLTLTVALVKFQRNSQVCHGSIWNTIGNAHRFRSLAT